MSQSIFLTEAEVDELTGVRRARTNTFADRKVKRTKYEMQVAHLRSIGIPFHTNVAGRPIVARVSIEGRGAAESTPRRGWEPRILSTT